MTIVESNGLSSELIFIKSLRESSGGQVVKAGRFPLPVEKVRNVLGNLLYCLRLGAVALMMNQLIFERIP